LDLIKERLYYSIGEVSSILNVNPSTIRYWEKQFLILRPTKRTGTSKRKFEITDIQTIFKIKSVLKDDKITIRKAKVILQDWKPETSFEEFKRKVEDSNRPEIVISKEKLSKMKDIFSNIRELLIKIK